MRMIRRLGARQFDAEAVCHSGLGRTPGNRVACHGRHQPVAHVCGADAGLLLKLIIHAGLRRVRVQYVCSCLQFRCQPQGERFRAAQASLQTHSALKSRRLAPLLAVGVSGYHGTHRQIRVLLIRSCGPGRRRVKQTKTR